MSTELDELAAALDDMSSPGSENEKRVPSGQRPCPICGETMTADNFSGFPIDACAMHGIWLDNGELRSILARRRAGERQRFNKASAGSKGRQAQWGASGRLVFLA